MPRMSKKRKLELSFFLNDRGRVAYNDLCRKCQHKCKQSFRAVVIDTVLPPCMPLPAAMLRLPISSTAKVMYARLLNTTLTAGIEDSNGILFVRFPIMELAAALSRSPVTVKRSLKELEDIGLILRVRRGVGEPNRIYTLLPKGGLP